MEPIGAVRGDAQIGMLAALIANINRKAEAEPFSTLDFMPFYRRDEVKDEPIFVDDKDAQSSLIASLFGMTL